MYFTDEQFKPQCLAFLATENMKLTALENSLIKYWIKHIVSDETSATIVEYTVLYRVGFFGVFFFFFCISASEVYSFLKFNSV